MDIILKERHGLRVWWGMVQAVFCSPPAQRSHATTSRTIQPGPMPTAYLYSHQRAARAPVCVLLYEGGTWGMMGAGAFDRRT